MWGLEPASGVWGVGRSRQGGRVGAGWLMSMVRPRGGKAGVDNIGAWKSKPGVRGVACWFSGTKLTTSGVSMALGGLWLGEGAPSQSK